MVLMKSLNLAKFFIRIFCFKKLPLFGLKMTNSAFRYVFLKTLVMDATICGQILSQSLRTQ